MPPHDRLEIGHDLRPAGKHGFIGGGHDDGHGRPKTAFER